MKFSMQKAVLLSAASAVAISIPSVGLAQDSEAATAEAASIEEEAAEESGNVIIVTARKSEENLLDVPVALTAFGADEIEDIGLSSLEDIQGFTPGFSYEAFGTSPGRFDSVPRFRGVSVNTAVPTRQTASVFVDGIFVANGVQGIDFQDVERIEVIKGPQSAFFGRNTFGGAVNFITRTPGDDLAVNAAVLVATRGQYEMSGGLEGPIIGDVVKARVTGAYKDKRGHHVATDGGRIGDQETWSVAGTVFVEPSPAFDAKIRVSYFENDDGPPAASVIGMRDLNCGPSDLVGNPAFPSLVEPQDGPFGGTDPFFCGVLPSVQSTVPTTFSEGAVTGIENLETLNGPGSRPSDIGLDRQSLRTSLQFNVNFPDSSVVFSSLTGLNYDEVNSSTYFTASGSPLFIFTASRQFRDFSQELRFSGQSFGDVLDWSIGGNYFNQRLTSSGPFGFSSGRFFGDGSAFDEEQIDTTGIFGSLGINITEQLNLTAEGRYQIDQVAEGSNLQNANPFLKATFKTFLPRVILEYQPGFDTLFYASYSKGNLPGGFNEDVIELAPADFATLLRLQPFSSPTFDEEELEQYEVGIKHGFADGRGSLTVAGYYLDRTNQTFRSAIDIPLAGGGTSQIGQFLNVGRSEAYGFELESNYEILTGLVLAGTLSYVDSEYVNFLSTNVARVFGNPDAAGRKSDRFPKWAGSLSAQYDGTLNDTWDWFARADATYSGKTFASEVNLAQGDDSTVVNLRVGAKSDSLRIEAFVTNVTDEDGPTAAVRSTDLTAGRFRISGNSPFLFIQGLRDRRQFGIRTSVNF